MLLFCQCGSDRVDIKMWNVRGAQLHMAVTDMVKAKEFYTHVFVYHNGSESYYAARAFRGSLRI